MSVRIIGREINQDAIDTAIAAGFTRVHCDVLQAPPHKKISGYIASSPCQTFSAAGKGDGKRHLEALIRAAHLVGEGMHPSDAVAAVQDEELDERSILALHPLRVIRESRPDWVAMEQVRGVMPLWLTFAEIMRGWGYLVRVEVLHAEQYGVPQTRARAIFVAVHSSLASVVPWPEPTHSRYYSRDPSKLDPDVPKWVSMAEALGRGMTERPSMTVTGGGTAAGGAEPFGNAARQRMQVEREGGALVMRSNYGTGGDASNRGERSIDEPAATVTGKVGRNKWVVATGQNSAQAGGTTKPYVRDVDLPSPTITGALDNGNFRWVNPDEPSGVRVTVQEAAILQSFRPDYPWQGKKTSQYQRVGDCIPPLLAAAVLGPILELFPDGSVLEDFAGPGGWDEGARLAEAALAAKREAA